ncbi:4-amino-4-deoxychorismate lyase [Herbihabitans rhizosphaerae]|uniref:4-amino-4-deoxychorismate lyase n=1 Tax=Herbihabitans rhizosphaerae TaxID=1872711 RepID=A0A4Q7L7R3_9PSEU|nr:aminodeoxychorismate lyase [Herbihabitans rhizosphaerae]RZS44940.1 4-amino-4-deoxychorismate lyase [Herbihabitans rhizosphaerae]
MRVLAMLDGTLADPEAPHIRVDDLGLMRGDGIFETILVRGRHARELGPHLDRLARSAAMMELPVPDRAGFERACKVVIDNWPDDSDIALKVIHTRGVDGSTGGAPTGFALGMSIAEKTLRARELGVAAVTLDRGIDTGLAKRAPWLLLGAKSLSYAVNMAALREAERRGADEAVFVTGDGEVLEGPTATVILVNGRTMRTTPPDIGILPGTTQAAIFRAAERAGWQTLIEPLRVEDLRDADGMFLVSSVRTVTRVHTLDGQKLTDASELHTELTALYESEYTPA